MFNILLTACLLLITGCAAVENLSAKKYLEKDYQREWCESVGGKMEVVLEDGARVDCLTDEYAIEVDYAKKWAESIGQSLYYAAMTKRKPGVLLITRGAKDQRYLTRLQAVAKISNITIWTTPFIPTATASKQL